MLCGDAEHIEFIARKRGLAAAALMLGFLVTIFVGGALTETMTGRGYVGLVLSLAGLVLVVGYLFRGPVVITSVDIFVPLMGLRGSRIEWGSIVSYSVRVGTMAGGRGLIGPAEWIEVERVGGGKASIPLFLIKDRDGFLDTFQAHVVNYGFRRS